MAKYENIHDLAQSAKLKRGQMVLFRDPGDQRRGRPAGPVMVGRASDWRVAAWLSLNDRDELVIFRLEVRPWGDDVASIGSAVLTQLPLSRWLAQAHSRLTEPIVQWLKEQGGDPGSVIDSAELRRLHKTAERLARSTPPRPGAKGFGDAYYRRLALDYLTLQSQGVSRGIRLRLAEQESQRQGREVTDTQVRDALSKATELGYLAPGQSGRAGRKPGPRLLSPEEEDSTNGES